MEDVQLKSSKIRWPRRVLPGSARTWSLAFVLLLGPLGGCVDEIDLPSASEYVAAGDWWNRHGTQCEKTPWRLGRRPPTGPRSLGPPLKSLTITSNCRRGSSWNTMLR